MEIYGYLLKVSVCIVVFYGFYMLTLRNSTFFALNRWYLLLGMVASFAIPILNVPILPHQSAAMVATLFQPVLMEAENELFQPQYVSNQGTAFDYSIILPVIYLIGILFLSIRLFISVRRIIRIQHDSSICRIGKIKVIKTDLDQPFSFFNMIFLPAAENDQLIIRHEMAHIRQFHWLDLIFIEVASILLWFNPFVYLYKKSLKLQHEYLADASITKNENQIEGYLYCMLRYIRVKNCGVITSQFYSKTIKKRITMITKNRTSKKYLGVYLLALPLVCSMLYAFSGNEALAQEQVILEHAASENQTTRVDSSQPSIYPVDSKAVTGMSAFGERENPKTKKKYFHSGVDFAVPAGEKVVSTATGVIVEAQFDTKKGNYVLVQHGEVFSTLYSHLKSISVQVGDKLEKGQLIGHAGSTGLSTASHLHYEVLKNKKNVDPQQYLPR